MFVLHLINLLENTIFDKMCVVNYMLVYGKNASYEVLKKGNVKNIFRKKSSNKRTI